MRVEELSIGDWVYHDDIVFGREIAKDAMVGIIANSHDDDYRFVERGCSQNYKYKLKTRRYSSQSSAICRCSYRRVKKERRVSYDNRNEVRHRERGVVYVPQ
jgi:hypothetical protein